MKKAAEKKAAEKRANKNRHYDSLESDVTQEAYKVFKEPAYGKIKTDELQEKT